MHHTIRTTRLILLFSIFLLFLGSCEDNVNEPSVEDQEFVVDENAPPGTIVGVVAAFDLDPGQAISFRITGGNEQGIFTIDREGGHIEVANPSFLDYENLQRLTLTVVVSDDGEPVKESQALISVIIRDVNEFDPVMEDQDFDLASDAPAGTLVGTLEASDPEEPHQGILFAIGSGNETGIFSLNTDSGELSVTDASALSAASSPLILTIIVRDLHINTRSSTATVTVNLTPK